MPQRLPRVGYARRKYTTAADKIIEDKLEKECARYDVSRSFVIRNALAFVFNVDVEPYINARITKTGSRMRVRK